MYAKDKKKYLNKHYVLYKDLKLNIKTKQKWMINMIKDYSTSLHKSFFWHTTCRFVEACFWGVYTVGSEYKRSGLPVA